ncbi:MAG: hypothetical protein BWY77_01813 [bacterium ADurb.Bin431]|nr:MAG: hypothetical protein BWY77_01813 [bacterium ADurb.Bin431]
MDGLGHFFNLAAQQGILQDEIVKGISIDMQVQLRPGGQGGWLEGPAVGQHAHVEEGDHGADAVFVAGHPQQGAQHTAVDGELFVGSEQVFGVAADEESPEQRPADDVIGIIRSGRIGAFDVDETAQPADEIGQLGGLFRRAKDRTVVAPGLFAPCGKFGEGGMGAAGEDEDGFAEGMNGLALTKGAVLDGAEEEPEPAVGAPEFGVEFVEENQRDAAAQGDIPDFVKGGDQILHRGELGEIELDLLNPAGCDAFGDLADAEGLAGAGRAEDCHSEGFALLFRIQVFMDEIVNAAIALDLGAVDAVKVPVSRRRHPVERGVPAMFHIKTGRLFEPARGQIVEQ